MSEKDLFVDEVESSLDIPKEKRKLETASYDYSVDFLYNHIRNGKIILEVPFQRRFIWKNDKCSRLIESLIMNVPIPPIYLSEEKDGKWLVIDGLQRLSAITSFYQNEYFLVDLEIVKELNGMKYKDLPPRAKSLLSDGMLRIIVIKQESHPDIKFDIFMRLNNGAVNLNDQELRNCLYRGKIIELAKKLANNEQYLSILNTDKPDPRFADVEYILRYFAFSENVKNKDGHYYVEGYSTSIKSFINNYLENNKDISNSRLDALERKFNTAISNSIILFGKENAFRDGKLKIRKVNKSIADCTMISLENVDQKTLVDNLQAIRAKAEELMQGSLQNFIKGKTSNTTQVNGRIDLMLRELINA
ncbi:MAG: DUF262 domain-containing protein [Ignavibacteriales bacterium]|nr:DUF262 domain-containing protein [Ignavibacteriales bacterium]